MRISMNCFGFDSESGLMDPIDSEGDMEGGATGIDFIKLFDADGDRKVTHSEWEKVRPSTVFKDKHWPEYNKNNDEYITVDEAPKPPTASGK
jgi:hypothetical protein